MDQVDRNPLGAVFLQGRARSFFEGGLRETFQPGYEPFPAEIDSLLQQLRDDEREG
jgi:hypothetical protein